MSRDCPPKRMRFPCAVAEARANPRQHRGHRPAGADGQMTHLRIADRSCIEPDGRPGRLQHGMAVLTHETEKIRHGGRSDGIALFLLGKAGAVKEVPNGITFAGGVPIMRGMEFIGAVGTSGVRAIEDEQISKAGASVIK